MQFVWHIPGSANMGEFEFAIHAFVRHILHNIHNLTIWISEQHSLQFPVNQWEIETQSEVYTLFWAWNISMISFLIEIRTLLI